MGRRVRLWVAASAPAAMYIICDDGILIAPFNVSKRKIPRYESE
jgi:hypothetical protein